jgi:hypothetical protein
MEYTSVIRLLEQVQPEVTTQQEDAGFWDRVGLGSITSLSASQTPLRTPQKTPQHSTKTSPSTTPKGSPPLPRKSGNTPPSGAKDVPSWFEPIGLFFFFFFFG